MVDRRRIRVIFHVCGVAVVACWLVMIGLLVRKIHFKEQLDGPAHAVASATIESATREWKEIYLGNKKVGYAINLIRPFKEGYYIQEEIFLKLNLMGLGSDVYSLTQSQVNKEFLLKSFFFRMTSGVVRYDISGKVAGDVLKLETRQGKEKRTQTIPLSKPPMIGAGMSHFFKSRKLRVGEIFRLPLFDPSTMGQKEVFVRVVSREPLEVHRITYDAFRLEADMWGKSVTFWIDEHGESLKEEGFMGLTAVRSSAARAPLDIERKGGADLYEMTAIEINKVLEAPERLSYLELKVDGVDPVSLKPEFRDGKRQTFHKGVLKIEKESPPVKASFQLQKDVYNDEIKTFLEPEFNIESDDEKIIREARKIIGSDTDPISATRKLLDWVYQSIEKRPVVSVPSALEVLKTKVGDCNEHATLLTALLRASGIPARLCIGLVYTRQKFFYHAWTEAYVGEWISLDATLNQMPADVTHIKLLEGNLDKQVEVVGLVGTLRLEVLDYRYD